MGGPPVKPVVDIELPPVDGRNQHDKLTYILDPKRLEVVFVPYTYVVRDKKRDYRIKTWRLHTTRRGKEMRGHEGLDEIIKPEE